jgi:hypothetical protein
VAVLTKHLKLLKSGFSEEILYLKEVGTRAGGVS